jgi:hypothetical protein
MIIMTIITWTKLVMSSRVMNQRLIFLTIMLVVWRKIAWKRTWTMTSIPYTRAYAYDLEDEGMDEK